MKAEDGRIAHSGSISRPLYLCLLGRYHKICGNLSVATPLLQEAVKMQPDIAEGWNALGQIYHEEGEVVAAKFCFESALDFDRGNQMAYICLSKILRTPTGKNQMEIMENSIESLVLAKQALKLGRKGHALRNGELWFNLGNAYLMAFLNCCNGFKLDSSKRLEEEDAIDRRRAQGQTIECKYKDVARALSQLDEGMFAEERAQDKAYNDIRREIEVELTDSGNDLLSHVYIRKCLSAYKCAATKCTVNRHDSHPDLFCNRAHLHIHQELYEEALVDLRYSIRFSAIEKGECQAQVVLDSLLPKLVKMSRPKPMKKVMGMVPHIRSCSRKCAEYYINQCHYDLTHFALLDQGLNGGKVIVLRTLSLLQPAQQMPFHLLCIDDHGSLFVLSFYLRGHALNHIQTVLDKPMVVNASTIICVANPVKRHVKFRDGNKNIDFYTVTFQKPEDICIGGKFFFNQTASAKETMGQ